MLELLAWATIGVSAFRGFKRGLIREAMAFLGLALGLVLAGQWYPYVADALKPLIGRSRVADALSFLLVLSAVLLCSTVITVVLQRVARFLLAGWLDRLGGAALGAGQGAVVVALVLLLLLKYPIMGWDAAVRDSQMAMRLVEGLRSAGGYLPRELAAVAAFLNDPLMP